MISSPQKVIANSFYSNFAWTDSHGMKLKTQDFKGRTVVATMAYATCKKICIRSTVPILKDIYEELEKRKESAEFFVFSLDPQNDQPQDLGRFLQSNKIELSHWHFLVGDLEQTKKISTALSLGDSWTMDDHIIHKFKITVFRPDGSVRYVFDWDHRNPKEIPNQ
jgi:protein SCO1/2